MIAAAVETRPFGWLRDERFDLTLIVGTAALALASGMLALAHPEWFPVIFFADLWLLGYHHVIATFTRLCFDGASVREHKFFLFGLPVLVVIGVASLAFGVGAWTIATLYFYWQAWHYARQSWGVSRAYARKAGAGPQPDGREQLVFYLMPIAGVLWRSAQGPETFLGMPFIALPVPQWLAAAALAAAALGLAWQGANRFARWRRGELPAAESLYLFSHHLMFFAGYVLIPDITFGWLAINVWHNAQYLLFVRLFNEKKFSKGEHPGARVLAWMSQPRNLAWYFVITLAISTAVYAAIGQAIAFAAVVPGALVYMAINFHHYVVDAYIWKARTFKKANAA